MRKNFTYLKTFVLVMSLMAGTGCVFGQSVSWKLIKTVDELTAGEYLLSTLDGKNVFNGVLEYGEGQLVSRDYPSNNSFNNFGSASNNDITLYKKVTVADPDAFSTPFDFSSNDIWNFPVVAAAKQSVHNFYDMICTLYDTRYVDGTGLLLTGGSGYVIVSSLDNQIVKSITIKTPSASIAAGTSLKLTIGRKDISTIVVDGSNQTYTIGILDTYQTLGSRIKLQAVGGDAQIASIELSGTVVIPATEVTPENVESTLLFDQSLTASGDWTQSDIESLALVISESVTPVTSVKFTGSVNATAHDEIFDLTPNCLKLFAEGVTVPDAWMINVVKLDADGNATSENISLDATFPFATPVKIKAEEASFIRPNLVPGNKNTVYLPFAASIPAGFEVYSFSNVTGTTVNFAPVEGTFEANKPYLFIPDASELNISETNVDVIPEPQSLISPDYQFLGTYVRISADGLYGFKDNSFKLGLSTATVPAFRGYLKPALLTSGAPSVLSIDVSGEGTTGIENAVFEGTTVYVADGVVNVLTDHAQTVSIYGIDGRLVRTEVVGQGHNRINGLAKGIYLVNNRKVIIK